jgi:hypothetical protein
VDFSLTRLAASNDMRRHHIVLARHSASPAAGTRMCTFLPSRSARSSASRRSRHDALLAPTRTQNRPSGTPSLAMPELRLRLPRGCPRRQPDRRLTPRMLARPVARPHSSTRAPPATRRESSSAGTWNGPAPPQLSHDNQSRESNDQIHSSSQNCNASHCLTQNRHIDHGGVVT